MNTTQLFTRTRRLAGVALVAGGLLLAPGTALADGHRPSHVRGRHERHPRAVVVHPAPRVVAPRAIVVAPRAVSITVPGRISLRERSRYERYLVHRGRVAGYPWIESVYAFPVATPGGIVVRQVVYRDGRRFDGPHVGIGVAGPGFWLRLGF